MGYSHYWSQARDLDAEEWKIVCYVVENIAREAEGQGLKLKYQLGPDFFKLNGIAPLGDYEDFLINRKGRTDFAFVKTGGAGIRPYDRAVCAIMCVLDGFQSGTVFRFWSDGGPDDDEWQDGLALALMTFQGSAAEITLPAKVLDDDLPPTL